MSLSSSDITTKLNGYITAIENSGKIYWNANKTPTKYDWGFTTAGCGSDCTSNYFGYGWQCNGFARFIAYLLTGITVCQNPIETDINYLGKRWVSTKNYGLAPGDIVEVYDEINGHVAIVLSVDGEKIDFLEVWGGEGCKMSHGPFNDGDFYDIQNNNVKLDNPTVSDMIRLATRIIKCPEISSVFCEPPATLPEGNGTTPTPEPEPEEEVKVPVTFKKNTQSDGGPIVETLEYIVGQAYDTLPSAGSRTGYTFAGWWPEKDSRSSEFTEDTIVPAWDHTLYAHWDANTYTLRCYTNYGDDDYEEYTVTYGQPYGNTLNPIEREGYEFNGWRTSRTDVNSSRYEKEDAVSVTYGHYLYAHWTPKEYAIFLYPGHGTNAPINGERMVKTNENYGTSLPVLTRCGYTHLGWRAEGDSQTVYTSESTVTKEITKFTAIWEVKTVKVKFNFDIDGVGVVSSNAEYGDNYPMLYTHDRVEQLYGDRGYDFKGWHHAEVTGDSKVQMDADHTLTAMWEPKELAVSFDAGDGEFAEEVPAITVRHGGIYGCLPVPKSKDLWEFSYWCMVDNDGNDGAIVTADTIVSSVTGFTLRAKWNLGRIVTYRYVDGNGMWTEKEYGVQYGRPYPAEIIPDIAGYETVMEFADDIMSKYNYVKISSNFPALPEHPSTIEAVYIPKIITVILNTNGGYLSNSLLNERKWMEIEYETLYDLPTPAKIGYTFTGWYYDSECTEMVQAGDRVATVEPHTLYAGWKKNITVSFDAGETTSFVGDVPSVTVYEGEPYGELPVPESVDHYKFAYWYIDDEDNYVLSDSTVEEAGDHTLTALWETSRTIWFYIEGETLRWSVASFGKPYPRAITPSKEGYTFDGWYFSGGDNDGDPYVANSEDYVALPGHSDMIVARFTPIP